MKNFLFLLASASALSLASCSQEKTSTTDMTTTPAEGTAMATTSQADMDAMVEARAQRIADQMVANMKITDEPTKTKIRTVYVNRGKRMNEMRNRYTADTAGMAAAMRDANAATDEEFRSIFTDPAQYQSYESSRPMYDEKNYMDDNSAMMSGDANSMSDGMNTTMNTTTTETTTMGTAAPVEKSKTKMTDGSKVKVKDDGTIKVKDADGTKTKM